MIKKVVKKIISSNETSEVNNFMWNMAGSAIVALASMVLSVFVIKITGPMEGGIFSIALTLSQMLMHIAYFETRTFQVTDADKKYTFGEYHAAKIFLSVLMVLASAAYIAFRRYYLKKAVIVLLVCIWKALDGYADTYESQFQTEGRLDLAGKSMAWRTALSVIIFLGALLLTDDLIISLVIMLCSAAVMLFIFDIEVMKAIDRVTISHDFTAVRKLIKDCLPLFVGVFCWVYILSASRIAIDNNMSSDYQSYYQMLFLPVSVISLFSGFVFKPLLPKLAHYYGENKLHKFYMIIWKGFLYIIIITFVCMAGAFLLGIPILSLLSGCDLRAYKGVLVFLIFCGGINAATYTLYYVLTIMRAMKIILTDYLLAALSAFLFSSPLVKAYGIEGAAASYFIAVMVLCILFTMSIIRINKRGTCKNET